MKIQINGLASSLLAFLLVGCTQVTTLPSYEGVVLPNGERATAEESAILQEMQPQLIETTARLEANRSIGTTDTDFEATSFNSYKALLVAKFGDKWKKFVKVQKASVTRNAETGEIVNTEIPHTVDLDTLFQTEARAVGPVARHSYQSDTKTYGYLSEFVECSRYSWWWTSYNIAKQSYFGPTGSPYTCISMGLTLTDPYNAGKKKSNINCSWNDLWGTGSPTGTTANIDVTIVTTFKDQSGLAQGSSYSFTMHMN